MPYSRYVKHSADGADGLPNVTRTRFGPVVLSLRQHRPEPGSGCPQYG